MKKITNFKINSLNVQNNKQNIDQYFDHGA